ncbi:bifunctional diguanylate cyclase/phosphodiesterase [Vreelandella populi]|uniref:bifunctional diguanylate cyclase/phosphodiesterase n=1 Tax=Vreelandella populi TaxID=2498858 RepID=UPI000F8F29CE|nr:EAL domain-containing protein [Halomonas populi]RUR57277.1 EAL domain-containing protein [Halomonas populi]
MTHDPAPIRSNDAASYTAMARLASRNFIYVICALFLTVGLTLIYLSFSLDEYQILHSETNAATALESRQDKVGNVLADNAFWIDAFSYTYGSINMPWAFERDNIGPSLFSTYGLDGVFIIGPNAATRYSIIDGELSDTVASEWITGDLPALLAKARRKSTEDEIAYAYFSVRGTPAVVSAAVIRPDSSYDQFDHLSYLVFVDVLTDIKLLVIQEAFGLRGLKANLGNVPDARRPQLRLQENVGEAVTLQWESEALGRSILNKFLPMLFLLGVLVAMLVKSLRRRIIHASEMIEAAQRALQISEQRFKNVSEAASDWIWETDQDQNLTYLSERFTQLTGLSCNDWVGRPLSELLTYNTTKLVSAAKHCNVTRRKPMLCEMRDTNDRLHYCQLFVREAWVGDQLQGYQGTVCDITQEVEAKAHIEYLSHHDALTGLANRHRLNHYLNDRLKQGLTGDRPLFLLALDLDRFKPINDTFGHATGDLALQEVANAISRCTRETDLVARLGGDEFIVVATDCRTYEDVERLCQRLIEEINQPIRIDGNDVSVGTSIGIAAAPYHGLTAEDLLRYGDIALYEAKSNGRNLFRFYEPVMNERIMERRQLEMDMRQALRRREFRLVFQPRYNATTQKIVGAEALVRWQHPTRDLLSPACFIPLAEETGLIFELSDWVLHEACLNALSWNDNVLVSVNLSPLEFQRNDLVDRIAAVIERTGIAPQRLELEITESVMLEDATSALTMMNKLKALGVRLSMDDFGTGYSSLGYLRSYPFDGIKIDRSFIMGLDQSQSGEALVNAIISMGHALALTVTAEGIETAEQLGKVVELACDQAQGFYLGRPVSPMLFRQVVEEMELS